MTSAITRNPLRVLIFSQLMLFVSLLLASGLSSAGASQLVANGQAAAAAAADHRPSL